MSYKDHGILQSQKLIEICIKVKSVDYVDSALTNSN